MEIEKKYLVKSLPEGFETYPSRRLTQSYISRSPVIRLRKIEKETDKGEVKTNYILTVKGSGLSVREEFELELDKEQYEELRKKEEGRVLIKRRYLIPLPEGRTAELDIFEGYYAGLQLVEVEFPSEEEMAAFTAPDWFGEDVSDSMKYHNSTLSGTDR